MDTFSIPTLVTDRLLLRAFRAGDVEDYAALNADPEVLRFRGEKPWDRGRAWRHMAFLLGSWPLGGAGMWALEHRETGELVGIAGFSEPAGWPGFELAGALARRFWGQGYATESGREALAYAFTVLEKERIISLIHPENRASIRAAQRIGERLLGRIQHLGQEMLCYGLDRETWLREVAPEAGPDGPRDESAPRYP